MHWELSDEQNLYADSLREWLAARAAPEQVRSWIDNGDQREFDDLLTGDGWAGVGFDEALGGQGGGLLELALTARELGRVAAPSARWLARAVATDALAGEPALTQAALEGSELTVAAVRSDRIPAVHIEVQCRDGRLSGQVPCVVAANEGDHFLVPASTPEGATLLCIVERHADGVDVRPRALLDRSRAVGDVLFDSAVGRPVDLDEDTKAALTGLADRAAVLVAADAVGAAERMLDMTVEYAKQRKQFGRPIAAFQAVKHACAQMLVTIEAGQSIALFAAASLQHRGPEASLHAAAAKAQVTAHCAELADSALTVHGAIGYTWEYDLQLFYKRAKLNRILFGSPEAWNEQIASMLPILPAVS
ncbi:Acyl-CoA dehydrogenase related to the alkylation response protein AidB [Mycobacterium rhizamassiliense]|uniref:Acyl-CoA dehydrogenase related to the alkylation response protein AidB n=2 Tax=Mycobacterium TaxID=1763 RepID=A0A2U3PA73_9MYCO|nr:MULTISPECIES: acyl-CoA dehydrogenase family protein [Mycobacterium]SPM34826.1 Acyl-CoA dehydrogenase related to the alkylation response protein AidB [Mycobacterium rhizamassiliense]SPM40653.1 Acyl-CoA dehydrogenase related to the alkylation response protein AidB [Mycobacterium numidiamassiliense]